ncbi:hypothetical protein MRX96_030890 [Rhipicephalus microplus]
MKALPQCERDHRQRVVLVPTATAGGQFKKPTAQREGRPVRCVHHRRRAVYTHEGTPFRLVFLVRMPGEPCFSVRRSGNGRPLICGRRSCQDVLACAQPPTTSSRAVKRLGRAGPPVRPERCDCPFLGHQGVGLQAEAREMNADYAIDRQPARL